MSRGPHNPFFFFFWQRREGQHWNLYTHESWSPLHSWEEPHPLKDFVQKNPFFLVEWVSVEDLLPLDPNEKCFLKKGFAKELFMLALEPISGPFPSCPPPFKRSNMIESPSRSPSTTLLLSFLFLAFKNEIIQFLYLQLLKSLHPLIFSSDPYHLTPQFPPEFTISSKRKTTSALPYRTSALLWNNLLFCANLRFTPLWNTRFSSLSLSLSLFKFSISTHKRSL